MADRLEITEESRLRMFMKQPSLIVDPAHVGPEFAFPTDLAGLTLHDPHCPRPPGTGRLVIRDHRRGPEAQDVLLR